MSEDLSAFSMIDLFRAEAETQARLLSEGLLAIESDSQSAEALRSLMRAAHSLKGAARIVGLESVVQLAHEMENGFVAAQEGTVALDPGAIDTLLGAVDLLKNISAVPEAHVESWLEEKRPEFDRLVERLSRLRQDPDSGRTLPFPISPPPAPAPAPASPAAGSEPGARPGGGPGASSTADRPAAGPAADRVVRVGAENLDRLMELAAESLVEARRLKPFADALLKLKSSHHQIENSLGNLRLDLERLVADPDSACRLRQVDAAVRIARGQLHERIADFDGFLSRTASLSDRLYQEVIASRMRPFGDGVTAFPRMVRDLARNLGKKIRFTIEGRATDVDRDILERLEAPLNHLLRNAVDHGIEPPAERAARGKPEEGQLKLEARHAAGMLHITVSDDGHGIDSEALRQKVIHRGMVPADAATRLTEPELLEFLFLPGFSTAEKVTEISGRGVGLDVVQAMAQEIGGTVRVTTQPQAGATFHLQLPITRSVIRALIVEIAGEPYAVPLARIDRVRKVPARDLQWIEGRPYVPIDGRNIGLVPASQILELDLTPPRHDPLAVLVVSDRNQFYGLEVDRFLGERDLVVRPLDPRLGKVPDISSASLLEDGAPILIIDVDDLVRSTDNFLAGGRLGRARRATPSAPAQPTKRILIADDSITVRELERQLLEARGFDVETAVDGMEAWNAVRLGQYDLVISDVDMPRLTGIELVKLIKNDDRLRRLPVIIVSYKDRDEDRLRGLEAGANYYLTKSSFRDETFLQAVIDLLGKTPP